MASWLNLQSPRLAALAACTSAALFWFGTGLHPMWPLLWLAPLPILLTAPHCKRWQAALAASAASFVSSFNLWDYLHGLLTIPAAPLLLQFAGAALVFAVAVLLYRTLLLGGASFSAMLALPTVWVMFEYLINITSSVGTAFSHAYSQLMFLPVLQLASLTGPWGISFMLGLVPGAIAVCVHLARQSPRHAARIAALPVLLLTTVVTFGWLRLAEPSVGQHVKVGLIASGQRDNIHTATTGDSTRRLLQDYATQSNDLVAKGAQVIVMPEKLGTMTGGDQAEDQALQQLADHSNADVVAGMVTSTPTQQYNTARFYAPHAVPVDYHKLHMLPQFESMYTPGQALARIQRASGLWGVAICKDMDFTDRALQYGRSGTGLMLVPAWDFDVDAVFHGHIAIMRGVENGYSIVRAAKDGSLYVSDSRGRILAETSSGGTDFAKLLVDVPAAHAETFYQMGSDWLIVLTGALLCWILWRARRLHYR